ncbi:MAG: 30S ribosomal protein S20 [Alphaproteobacteria bacterium]|nr:30S ribosomal protein S20 [Alphaproteobacteria bacterium]
MANIRSAQKRARQSVVLTQRNAARRSRVRTAIRKVEEALASGDAKAAQEALKAAQPEIVRGAKKGLYHKKRAARKISRLATRIKTL